MWSRLTAKSMPNIQVHVMVIVWSRDLLSSTDSGRPAQASGVPTISIVPRQVTPPTKSWQTVFTF